MWLNKSKRSTYFRLEKNLFSESHIKAEAKKYKEYTYIWIWSQTQLIFYILFFLHAHTHTHTQAPTYVLKKKKECTYVSILKIQERELIKYLHYFWGLWANNCCMIIKKALKSSLWTLVCQRLTLYLAPMISFIS